MRLSRRSIPVDIVVGGVLPMLDLKDFVNLNSATVHKDADLDACFKLLRPIQLDYPVAMSFPALQWIVNKGFHVSTIVENHAGLDCRTVPFLNLHHEQIHDIDVRGCVSLPGLSRQIMLKVRSISLTGFEDSSQVAQTLSTSSVRSVTLTAGSATILLKALVASSARPEQLIVETISSDIMSEELNLLYSALEQKGTSLRDLSVRWGYDMMGEQVRKICAACPNLTALHLGESFEALSLTDDDLAAVAQSCPNLVTLGLPCARAPGVSGLGALARRCTRLRYVRFSRPLTTDQLLVFAMHGTALEKLQLVVPIVEPARLQTLLAGLLEIELQPPFLASTDTAVTAIRFMPQLRSVTLHAPYTAADVPVDFAAVVTALAQHCPLLQIFKTATKFARATPSPQLNAALTALFSGCRELTEFHMSGTRDHAYAWLLFEETLNAVPPTLRALTLDDCCCSAEALMRLLSTCKQLREVTLNPHNAGVVADDVVLALAVLCPHLQHVSVCGEHCAVAAPAVLKLAQRCRKLTRLHIPARVLDAVGATLRAEERLHTLFLSAPYQVSSRGDVS
jgi:hypothetical protein